MARCRDLPSRGHDKVSRTSKELLPEAVDVTGGIGGRSFFGSASKIRDVTYQGLVNVVEAARANGFGGRIVLLSGMGADRTNMRT